MGRWRLLKELDTQGADSPFEKILSLAKRGADLSKIKIGEN